MEEREHLYVGGTWSAATGGQTIEVISPHTEEPIARVAAAGPDDVDRAVAAARAAFDEGPSPRLDPAERVRAVRRLADLYGARRREMAQLINRMRIAREEIFGPVVSVIPYDDEDDAVRIANDSDYGLSGSVWTADDKRGLDVARRVRTGSFGVNQPYSMDPAAPFGGVKASGIGRELGREGLEGYLDVKAISGAPAG